MCMFVGELSMCQLGLDSTPVVFVVVVVATVCICSAGKSPSSTKAEWTIL